MIGTCSVSGVPDYKGLLHRWRAAGLSGRPGRWSGQAGYKTPQGGKNQKYSHHFYMYRYCMYDNLSMNMVKFAALFWYRWRLHLSQKILEWDGNPPPKIIWQPHSHYWRFIWLAGTSLLFKFHILVIILLSNVIKHVLHYQTCFRKHHKLKNRHLRKSSVLYARTTAYSWSYVVTSHVLF